MQPLRHLAASLLASVCVLPALAQSPRPLLSPDAHSPASLLLTSPSLGPSTPSTLKLTSPNSLQFRTSQKDLDALVLHPGTDPTGLQPQPKELALLKSDTTLLPPTNQPCAKLRSYNFTAKDLKATHAHASSETDCTPASAGHLKTIPATAADTK